MVFTTTMPDGTVGNQLHNRNWCTEFARAFIHFAQNNKMLKKPDINDFETSGKTATCAVRCTEFDIHKSMR
jgi:hypothetical protein